MKYDAITIDTEVVERNAFDFDGGLLQQLKQFKTGPVDVILSAVTVSEIRNRLIGKAKKAKDALESAHRKAVKCGLVQQGSHPFADDIDVGNVSKRRVDDSCPQSGAK